MNSPLEFVVNDRFHEIETKMLLMGNQSLFFGQKFNTKQQYGTLTQRWTIPNTYFGTFQANVLKKFPAIRFETKSAENIYRMTLQQQSSRTFNFGLSKKKGCVVLRTELQIDEEIFRTHEVIQKNDNAGPRKLLPFHFYYSCVQELQNKYSVVDFTKHQTLSEYLNNFAQNANSQSKINKELDIKLRHHQRECIRKGVELNGRMLIADDAGLGKTFSSLHRNFDRFTKDLNQTEEEFEIFFLPIQSLDKPQYLIMKQHLQRVENEYVQGRNRGKVIQDKLEKEFKSRITRSQLQIQNQQNQQQQHQLLPQQLQQRIPQQQPQLQSQGQQQQFQQQPKQNKKAQKEKIKEPKKIMSKIKVCRDSTQKNNQWRQVGEQDDQSKKKLNLVDQVYPNYIFDY